MIRRRFLFAVVLLAFVTPAVAERPSERREDASHVVVGTVTKVAQRDAGHNVDYVVVLRADEVERRDGVRRGDDVSASAFRRKPDAPRVPSAGGHKAIPKEGQRVRAVLRLRRGAYEANYPDWFDVLKPAG